MKYTETGFRAVYRNFCAFPLNDNFKRPMEGYPGIEAANCILVYGYIDKEAGMTLEVLAAGQQRGEDYRFFDGSKDTRFFIRIGAVENEEFAFFGEDEDLQKRYADKLDMLKLYDADEELEKTRGMGFLDESRHPHYPDDVKVYLTREGLKPEICWTRIFGVGDHWIMGILLNEPDQPFGYHEGEKIGFFVQETEDKHVICYTNIS